MGSSANTLLNLETNSVRLARHVVLPLIPEANSHQEIWPKNGRTDDHNLRFIRRSDEQQVSVRQASPAMLKSMNTHRVGRVLRAIRLDQRLTQQVVADRAGLSQPVYSRTENGELAGLTIRSLDRIVEALGASLSIDVRYRGGLGDRLADAAHAALVDYVVRVLRGLGWTIELEFGFNVFGERGSVDILGWHATTRTLLIVEVKSRFTDLQAMLASLGRKLRLVPDVARKAHGWDPAAVARVVVIYGTTGNRSILNRHAAIFDAVLPARSRDIKSWLRAPVDSTAGVWLVSPEAIRARVR